MPDKKILKINASSLPLSRCMLNWVRVIVEGYKFPHNFAAPVYGIAVHKYVDTMFKTGGNIPLARAAALASFNVPKVSKKKQEWLSDERHLFVTCYMYWEEFILKDTSFKLLQLPTGNPATEITFSIPFYEDEDYVVLLEGTIDQIGQIVGGCYSIGDHKTTSQYDEEAYLADYEMSSQLRFYLLSLKLMARKEPESVLGKIGSTNVGAFINGIFLKSKPAENKYVRSEVFIFRDLEEYEANLFLKVKQLLYALKHDTWHSREGILTGACEQKFSHCQFWYVCKAADPKVAEILLKRDFIQKTYDPLHHQD